MESGLLLAALSIAAGGSFCIGKRAGRDEERLVWWKKQMDWQDAHSDLVQRIQAVEASCELAVALDRRIDELLKNLMEHECRTDARLTEVNGELVELGARTLTAIAEAKVSADTAADANRQAVDATLQAVDERLEQMQAFIVNAANEARRRLEASTPQGVAGGEAPPVGLSAAEAAQARLEFLRRRSGSAGEPWGGTPGGGLVMPSGAGL